MTRVVSAMDLVPFPPADLFIETGFAEGATTRAAAARYSRVVSIELDPSCLPCALALEAACPHVSVRFGNSATLLVDAIRPELRTVFWLDAHFAPNNGQRSRAYLGQQTECPLLAELQAILSVPWVTPPDIFIDDVILFRSRDYTGTYAEGCTPADYPTEATIAALLSAAGYQLTAHGVGPRYYHARLGTA